MLVRDIMKSPVTVADAGATLAETYALMQEKGIRHLPVVEGGRVVGVVTDRDLRLATSSLTQEPFAHGACVADVMNQPPVTADPLDPVEEASRTMRSLKIGCLPVIAGNELVGIITGLDLLDALMILTGVTKPSARMELSLVDRAGELARLTAAIAERGINIHSILTYPEAGDHMRVVLRVSTIEVRSLAKDLRGRGFPVVWPPEKQW